jgi:hypothetical protein
MNISKAIASMLCSGHSSFRNGVSEICGGHSSFWNGVVEICSGHSSFWNGVTKTCGGLRNAWMQLACTALLFSTMRRLLSLVCCLARM